MNNVSMQDIERATAAYAREREKLAELIADLEEEMAAAKRRRIRGIRAAVQRANDTNAVLRELITAAPELFEKPRTRSLHGIRVGWMKGKGKIEFDDPAKVIKLIRKHLPDLAEVLVKTTETVVKTALKDLATADLKRIGCQVEESGDMVTVKPTDSQVDKIVGALLKEAETDQETDEQAEAA